MEIHIPYTTFTLPNGLRVFVHEDATVPLVSVNLWYHVGSKDERPGRTGFAHLFEHLMFEGSAHAPAGAFDQLLEAAGGVNNGSTSPDRTNYWETVPSDALALAFWLESDRMGWLAMSQETLDTQRDVVINERRQSYENRPYGLAYETVLAALYPPEHPYHWPVIGHVRDLEAATLEDVRAFFATYYAPNNATLAVAGHATAAEVEELAHRYFGEIPAGPPVPPVAAPPAALERDRCLVLEDRVRLPRVYLAWHSPPQFAPGDAALEAAAAILADGKASRLYRSLVYERQVAQDVDAFQDGGLLGSTFEIAVTARPGVGLGELEAAVRDELHRIARDGVEPAELDRARNRIETAFVDALQHGGGFGGKADRLNEYFFYTGDPGYADADLRRFLELTPEAVQAAVAEHLADAARVILSVVPKGRPELAVGGGA
ncbi:MAG: insulinase family protein [Gemmatimonadetes bacterium]|nr:insulinase family protein [Gemmatimonadota bacterium]